MIAELPNPFSPEALRSDRDLSTGIGGAASKVALITGSGNVGSYGKTPEQTPRPPGETDLDRAMIAMEMIARGF